MARIANVEIETWFCSWLVVVDRTEDGDDVIAECGAPAHPWKGGWACEAGHFHEPIERAWLPGSITHQQLGRDW